MQLEPAAHWTKPVLQTAPNAATNLQTPADPRPEHVSRRLQVRPGPRQRPPRPIVLRQRRCAPLPTHWKRGTQRVKRALQRAPAATVLVQTPRAPAPTQASFPLHISPAPRQGFPSPTVFTHILSFPVPRQVDPATHLTSSLHFSPTAAVAPLQMPPSSPSPTQVSPRSHTTPFPSWQERPAPTDRKQRSDPSAPLHSKPSGHLTKPNEHGEPGWTVKKSPKSSLSPWPWPTPSAGSAQPSSRSERASSEVVRTGRAMVLVALGALGTAAVSRSQLGFKLSVGGCECLHAHIEGCGVNSGGAEGAC